jgi:hypothetical protein
MSHYLTIFVCDQLSEALQFTVWLSMTYLLNIQNSFIQSVKITAMYQRLQVVMSVAACSKRKSLKWITNVNTGNNLH